MISAVKSSIKKCFNIQHNFWHAFSTVAQKTRSVNINIPKECECQIRVCPQFFKVTVLGACGRLGQALAFQLKQVDLVSLLALYDVKNSRTLALDLSHINTPCKVYHFYGEQSLQYALKDSKIVIFAIGVPRPTANIMKEELFACNVTNVVKLAQQCATYCPDAFLVVATNPVNCMVPVVANITNNDHSKTKVMGLCSATAMRARAIVAKCLGLDPKVVDVPVYGGHSDLTITPFISQMKPPIKIDKETKCILEQKIKAAASDVLSCNNGKGSAAKSVAFSAARFVDSLLKCCILNTTTPEYAYIRTDLCPGIRYMMTPFTMDSDGVKCVTKIPNIPEDENCLFQQALQSLKKDLKKADLYIRNDLSSVK